MPDIASLFPAPHGGGGNPTISPSPARRPRAPTITIDSSAVNSQSSIELPQRPVDASSDAGTYSCTYHGCLHRFESPAKLQKHKREGSPAKVHEALANSPYPSLHPLPVYDSTQSYMSSRPFSSAKKQSKWTAEEDALIIDLRGEGMKWEFISKRLPGRSAISCRLQYQNYLERRSEWDEERKNKLARLYERFKPEMWSNVAKELATPWRAAEAMNWHLGEQEAFAGRPKAVRIRNLRPKRRILGSDGAVGGVNAFALTDTGASDPAMALSFTEKYFTSSIFELPEPRRFQVGNGDWVETNKAVEASWNFRDAPYDHYLLKFLVVPNSPFDITLPCSFIKETKLFTENRHLIREKFVMNAGILGANFAGSCSHGVHGYVNGRMELALDDTGCEPHLMSYEYYKARGFELDTSEETELLFADGTIQRSYGRVHVSWAFKDNPDKSYPISYEVIAGCPFNIIIGQDLLYDTDAYNVHQNSFVGGLKEEDFGRLCGVSFYSSFSFLPNFAKMKSKRKDTAQDQSGLSDVEREVERRIRSENIIDSITDVATRQAEREREDLRQRLWASSQDSATQATTASGQAGPDAATPVDARGQPPTPSGTSRSSTTGTSRTPSVTGSNATTEGIQLQPLPTRGA